MPVSIKDIARLAGVSHSTVSRALRNSPLIPTITTQRIQEIARQQGYTASAVARSLVTRKTQAIGVVVTSIADPFNGDVVHGIEEVANQRQYSVILSTSQADPERELAVVRSFQERRVDGILVASSRVGELYLPVLAELKVPVVLINNQERHFQAHSISIDDTDGGRQVALHFIGLGHRHVAYVGDRSGMQSDVHRKQGFAAALAEAGFPLADQYVLTGDGKLEGGRAAGEHLLRLKPRPSAVFCYNDMTALGVLAALRSAHVICPDDISVAGFDDIVFAQLSQPALTTVSQPRREMGRRAASTLLALVNKELAEREVVIRGELIVRSSTAPLTN